jgi:hypothetical protein
MVSPRYKDNDGISIWINKILVGALRAARIGCQINGPGRIGTRIKTVPLPGFAGFLGRNAKNPLKTLEVLRKPKRTRPDSPEGIGEKPL